MAKIKFSGPAKRLRIFVGEQAKCKGVPLYHALVLKARELDMAGVTVCKGIEGFGANSRIMTSRLLDLSTDLPVIVELVDSVDYINKFLLEIDSMLENCLVTMDDIEIIRYSTFTGDRLKRLQDDMN